MIFQRHAAKICDGGFGPDAMRDVKVCPRCGAAAGARRRRCPLCGVRLPEETVYQTWLSRQPRCAACGAPAAPAARYCSACGARLPAAGSGEQEPC